MAATASQHRRVNAHANAYSSQHSKNLNQINEQHHQASNNAALNEDRIGIQSSHRRHLGGHAACFLLFRVASEIELPHAGPGRQVKVGIMIADLEYD